MTKNIAVIDEQGNRYEATWPKRAKGLVKSGRARFVDEKTICLARPPDKPEDKTMSENMGSNHVNLGNFADRQEDPGELESLGGRQEGLSDSAGNSDEKKADSQNLNLESNEFGNSSADENLLKNAASYLDAAGEGNGERQKGQQPMSREIVERILDQLDHFAADDAYIAKLADKHVDSEDMVNIAGLREATRQRHLEVYRSVLEKAIEKETYGHKNAMDQLEHITDWLANMNRDDFDDETWKMIRNKAFEMMNRITAAVC